MSLEVRLQHGLVGTGGFDRLIVLERCMLMAFGDVRALQPAERLPRPPAAAYGRYPVSLCVPGDLHARPAAQRACRRLRHSSLSRSALHAC